MIAKFTTMVAASCFLMGAGAVAAASKPPQVLVFGGTGMMGSAIVSELRNRGIDTTVFVRPTSRVEATVKTGAHLAVGDVLDANTISKALHEHHYDAVISAIGRPDNDTPVSGEATIYATGNNNITAAAKAAGVTQLIQLSNVGAGDSVGLVSKERLELSKDVYRDKTMAETALVKSGLKFTVIRTGALVGGDSTGTAILTEDHSHRKAIRVQDIAKSAVDCVMAKKCFRKVFHIYDPALDSLSAEQLNEERQKVRAYKDEVRATKSTSIQRGEPPQ